MRATQTLIVILQSVIEHVGADDTLLAQLKQAADADQATNEAQEAEIQQLKSRVDAFPAAFDASALETRVAALEAASGASVDLGPLSARIQALEDRNTQDDAAAAAAQPGAVTSTGTVVGDFTVAAPDFTSLQVGVPFASAFTAAGGVAPLAFSISDGALPDGLSMAAGGAISGVPTQEGAFSGSVVAHDANTHVSPAATFAGTVQAAALPVEEPPPEAASLNLSVDVSGMVVGQSFSASISSDSTTGDTTYDIVDGALPDGLSLSGAAIVGTPTTEGPFSVVIHGQDSTGAAGATLVTGTVAPAAA